MTSGQVAALVGPGPAAISAPRSTRARRAKTRTRRSWRSSTGRCPGCLVEKAPGID